MAKMHSNTNCTSVSWRGRTFKAADGVFDVPEEAIEELASHDLVLGDQTATPPPANTRPVAQWSNKDLEAKAAELGVDIEGLDRPALITAVAAALKPKE